MGHGDFSGLHCRGGRWLEGNIAATMPVRELSNLSKDRLPCRIRVKVGGWCRFELLSLLEGGLGGHVSTPTDPFRQVCGPPRCQKGLHGREGCTVLCRPSCFLAPGAREILVGQE